MTAASAEAERMTGDLSRLAALLDLQVDRESREESPEVEVLVDVQRTLADAATRLAGLEAETSAWAAVEPDLAVGLAVAREHLRLLNRSMERASRTSVNPHERLHLLRDGVFHAEHSLEELEALSDDALQATRAISREENCREFMSG